MPATSGAHRRGGEKEEPNEPPRTLLGLPIVDESPDYVRIVGGRKLLERIETLVKEPFYRFNTEASKYNYFIKPVHKVYKRKNGRRRIYVYYGRYWYRRDPETRKHIYSGVEPPPHLPLEPPRNPLDDVTIIIEGEDVIIRAADLDKVRRFVERVAREFREA